MLPKLTILTPSYNRSHTLKRLYDSLIKQKSDIIFEWLIIDDGSTDTTYNFVKEIINEKKINIQYIKQENQGKHIAINTGVNKAQGEWIFIVDSDDFLTDTALSEIQDDIQNLHYNEQLCYRKKSLNDTLIGQKTDLPETISVSPTDAAEIFQGDLAYIFETQALKENPFPMIPSEKFVPELYIWNKVADKYPIRFFTNKSIYVCEYMDDGYSKNFKSNLKRNPRGFLLFYKDQFKREKKFSKKLKCLIRSLQCIIYKMR